jgi:ABC-type polysaccharide/polyol phosphate transport system ATPase subunit
VMVSHSIKNVMEMCDTAAWIDRGRVVSVGDATTVATEYLAAAEGGDDTQRR